MQILDAAATRAALPMPALVAALRTMFAEGCTVPARHVHVVGNVTSLLMPAWTPQAYGVKVVNVAPTNAALGLPGVHASYVLHDAATGAPRALLDGAELTSRRTAAASALAASYLAREDARTLLVVGAGRVAALLPEAYAAVRPIDRVLVWSRRFEAAMELAEQVNGEPVAELPAAVAQADIVSCATLATAPVVQGAWLHDGQHLDLIGSFTPAMREADDDCFCGAGLWIDTDEALVKSGELLGPLARGVFAASDVRGTLEALCRGSAKGRRSAAERTVFKSVGTALEDLAAALLACPG